MTEQDTRDKVITALTEISNIKSDINELKEANAAFADNQQLMIRKLDGLTKDRNVAVAIIGALGGAIGAAGTWVMNHWSGTGTR